MGSTGTPCADEPLVSIVIASYDYERFLAQAIDSALAQTHPAVEVVVVDDGSTDRSPDIIRGYGDRVDPVFQPNAGQAAAWNTGRRQASGDIVLFLDADDRLDADVVSRIVACFAEQPDLAKVQFRLRVVDAEGRPTGGLRPTADQRMPDGDVLAHVRRFGRYVAPPTSGNAFAAVALERIGDVPEEPFRGSPDAFLKLAIAMCGPIRSLDAPGGDYRIHGSNMLGGRAGVETHRRRIQWAIDAHEHLRRLADRLGVRDYPEDVTEPLDANFTYTRLRSLLADPEGHPIPSDRAWRLLGRTAVAAALDPQRSVADKARRALRESTKLLRLRRRRGDATRR